MAKLSLLLFCAVLLHTGYALQCYNCVSSPTNKNCEDFAEKEKIAVASCGKTVSPGLQPACIKKVIADKATNVQNTTRACILTKTSDSPHECAQTDRVNVVFCEICTDDLCNAAEQTQLGVVAIVGAALALFAANRLH